MDPLSLTVSVLTLVTIAAKLVEVGNTYRNALKNQRADVQQLMTEISFLGKVLASIGTTLDGIPQETLSNDAANTGTSPNILRGPLAECEKELLELLRFLASQLEGRNRFTRFGRRLKWPMKEKETKIWIEKIGRFKSTLQIQLQSYTCGINGKAHVYIAEIKKLQEEERKEDLEDKKNQKYRDALAWLSLGSNHVEIHACKRRLRQPGTGKWLLETDVYQKWGLVSQSILWLSGDKDMGKSVLSSIIIDHTQQHDPQKLLYFYCTEDHPSNPVNVYGSLIAQFLDSATMELPDYIGTYFDECGHRRPCEQELREIILKLVSTIPFGITIIIDGLDECKDFEGLLSGLFEIRDAGEIKMVITTRQDPDIAPHSDDLFEMHVLPSLVADDIALFVAHEVERRKTLKSLRSDLKDEVTRVVIEEANGVFGKARHLVEKVAKARSNDAAKRTLEELVSARERRIHEEEVAGCENEKGGDSGVSFQTVSPPRSPRTLHTAVVLPD